MGRHRRILLLVPALAAGLVLPALPGTAGAAPAVATRPAGPPDDPAVQERLNALQVQAFYADALSAHRLSLIDRYLRPDLVEHSPTMGPGRAGVVAYYRDFLRSFPDARAEVANVVAQNDRVSAYVTWTGHAAGTGLPLTLHTADIYRYEHGRVAEHWDVVDYSGLEAFGVPAPDQMQPGTPVDWRGTAADQANIRMLLDFTTEVLQQRQLDRAGIYLAEDLIQHEPTIPPGLTGFQSCFHHYFGGFPDMTFEIQHVLASSDHVVVYWVWRGHEVSTGRPLLLHTSDMYRVAGGKFVEHWNTVDFTALEPFGIRRP